MLFDLHTHILFDVDHGVQNIEDSIKQLQEYKKQGFDFIVLTPHIYHPEVICKVQNIRENFERLKQEADKIGISIFLGSELYLEAQTEIKSIPICGKYALVEFSPYTKPLDLEGKLNQLILQNLQPIIAHVERYNWLKPDSSEIELLNHLDCLLSVNISGIENHRADPYLQAGLIQLIASDNHGDTRLPRKLKKALEKYNTITVKMQSIAENIRGLQ